MFYVFCFRIPIPTIPVRNHLVMAGMSLVNIDFRTHLTSRTIHVSKLLSVTVCFYLNHPVTHWWLALNTPTYHVHHTHEYIHHTKWNHTLANLSRASHARVYTSYEMESHARQRILYAVTVRPKSLYEDVDVSTDGMRWYVIEPTEHYWS